MDARTEKYDRQLRLWGEEGQSALERARICLVGATAAGTETLKNLVLPGIGGFTIVDDHVVDERDLANNFFVDASSLGRPRAEVVTELLAEMNDAVKGESRVAPASSLVSDGDNVLSQFDLVIVSNIHDRALLLKLAKACWDSATPLFVIRTVGLGLFLRLVVPQHQVTDLKPDQTVPDLRLTHPFPELADFAAEFDLDSMSTRDFAHVPCVVLLLHVLKQWKDDNGGAVPSTSAEKDAFKKRVKALKRTAIELDDVDDQDANIGEALQYALRCWVPPRIPSEVQALFASEACSNITSKSDKFWVIARALKDFVSEEGDGMLPLAGSIPDMHSNTDTYLKLQRIYLDKAERDMEAVLGRAQALAQENGLPSIAPAEVRHCCKFAADLRVIHYRSLADEYTPGKFDGQQVEVLVGIEPEHPVHLYLALRAADEFFAQHRRMPGAGNADCFENDVAQLRTAAQKALDDMSVPLAVLKEEYLHEFCRYGGAELHNIAAVAGGIASQEAIKILTHQRMPINNTYIWSGINGGSATLQA